MEKQMMREDEDGDAPIVERHNATHAQFKS